MLKVPTPEFYILYNGEGNAPRKNILKLSDAFIEAGKPLSLELKVKFININLEETSEVLERSKTLREYSYFIDTYRKYCDEGYAEELAMKKAHQHCVSIGVMKEFLKKYEAEVLNMDILAWTYEEAVAATQEDGREEGREEGRREKERSMTKSLLNLRISLDAILQSTTLSRDEVVALGQDVS